MFPPSPGLTASTGLSRWSKGMRLAHSAPPCGITHFTWWSPEPCGKTLTARVGGRAQPFRQSQYRGLGGIAGALKWHRLIRMPGLKGLPRC